MELNVKAIREKHGLTQQQLADELGVNVLTVSAWERGKRKPLPVFRQALIKLQASKAGDRL